MTGSESWVCHLMVSVEELVKTIQEYMGGGGEKGIHTGWVCRLELADMSSIF